MTLWSGGTDDILIGFDATDHIRVQKEGTGDNFVTTGTFTSTTAPYHIVVSRPSGGPTAVYVNGDSKAGSTTARTFANGGSEINIGRKLSTTDQFFAGTINHVAFYSTALSAATALAHYRDGWTIVPDEIDYEVDINDAGSHVYVKGGNAAGSGWVVGGPSRYGTNAILDRPQSTSAALRDAIGKAYLNRELAPVSGGRAIVSNFDGWRAGQSLAITDAGLGLSGNYEIFQLATIVELGSGNTRYEIDFGALPWSATFDTQRRRRRTGNATSQGRTGRY
jgi:hypothetical protein